MKRAKRSLRSELDYHIDRVTQDYIARRTRSPGSAPAGDARIRRRDADRGRTTRRTSSSLDRRPAAGSRLRGAHAAPEPGISGLRSDDARTRNRREYRHLQLDRRAHAACFARGAGSGQRSADLARTENCASCDVSYALFEFFRDHLTSLSGSLLEMPIVQSVTVDGLEEELNGDEVPGRYYEVLGLTPAAGRLLGPADDAAPTPVAVISYDYWRRRFGLAPRQSARLWSTPARSHRCGRGA